MSIIQDRFLRSHFGPVTMAFAAAAVVFISAPRLTANNKPTELPAKVIAHLTLKDAPGSEMLLQNKGDKQFLYVQKASKQGFVVIDVTKPVVPTLVSAGAQSTDATAGKLEIVLRLTKEAGTHVIALCAEREVGVPAVIRTTACHDGVRIAALVCGLRLLVCSTKNPV